MKSIKIFISSVQKEFSKERSLLCDYIRQDALLGKFFSPFLFEELPAINQSAQQAYLSEVELCDIYLGIFGDIFVKKSSAQRHQKELNFITKVESSVVRKSFVDSEELRSAVYAALVHYLEEKEYLRILPFDVTYNSAAISAGYIVPSHPDNPTHPNQTYSLTEKGMVLFKRKKS